jgi:hypothetical protein
MCEKELSLISKFNVDLTVEFDRKKLNERAIYIKEH